MTCRTADQAAQNVAAALIGRHDTIGNHEGTGLHVISDDTQRNVFLVVHLVLGMCQSADLIQKGFVGIYREQRIYVLNDNSQTLQTHTGIDVLLL